MRTSDPVERALELLRDATCASAPDPVLQMRLRRRCFELSRRTRSRGWPLFALAILSGAALAASHTDWLRRWWFHLVIDGVERTGVVEGDGEHAFEFESADGETSRVLVSREHDGDLGSRTRLDVRRTSDQRLEHDAEELVTGGTRRALLPTSVLEGALSLHSFTDAAGDDHELFALLDGEGGSRLFVQHGEFEQSSVEELARVPFDVLGDGASVEITEPPAGGLELSFENGGAEIRFAWSCKRSAAPPGSAELETPDGRVRLRVEDFPLER